MTDTNEAIVSIPAPKEGGFQVLCFPMGKADSFLLRTAHSAVLIDSGAHDRQKLLSRYLLAQHVQRLDYFISTHFDEDHIGGTEQILKAIQVEDIIQSPYHKKTKSWKEYDRLIRKKHFRPDEPRRLEELVLDGVFYTIRPPEREHYDRDEDNNRSLIVEVQHGDNSFLFTGDAQNRRLAEYLTHAPGPYTWLKVPYHGKYQTILPAFFQQIQPKVAVITSSPKREESPKTVSLLQAQGCEVVFTRDGLVVFESDGQKLTKRAFTSSALLC